MPKADRFGSCFLTVSIWPLVLFSLILFLFLFLNLHSTLFNQGTGSLFFALVFYSTIFTLQLKRSSIFILNSVWSSFIIFILHFVFVMFFNNQSSIFNQRHRSLITDYSNFIFKSSFFILNSVCSSIYNWRSRTLNLFYFSYKIKVWQYVYYMLDEDMSIDKHLYDA